MAGRFLIPLTRLYAQEPARGSPDLARMTERFPASTLAIPLFIDPSDDLDGMVVRRQDGGRSRRVSQARPMFRVTLESPSVSEDVPASRLELIPVGRRVLIHVPARRRQLLQYDLQGTAHILLSHSTPRCREETLTYDSPFLVGVPTCPGCLADESYWEMFYIQPYEPPEAKKRLSRKEERERREYERRPTVFDKLLDDAFAFDAPCEPRPSFRVDPETIDETEDYVDGRDGKLASARQSQTRYEVQKQAIRSEILTRRRR